jgi:hypothetical protein
MKRLDFICTFKSDIVLHASSNTEGKIEKLDYIPGSNFLGMVARDYVGFGADAFDVFHSGEVCFGDGHIMVDGEPTYHVPFSFQSYKGISFDKAQESDELFVHHFLEQSDFEEATAKGTQYKQQRVGFFTSSGKHAKLEHSYKQKSAYNKHKRRSKDSSMFGYHALPVGNKWAFSVTIGDNMEKYEEKIRGLLVGKKRLGKSKSAEYGLVEIKEHTKSETSNITNPKIQDDKYLYLYAKSRWVLTDENGINSYMPSMESLGFSKDDTVKIDWNKSQIRTSRYTPYVGARRNFDPERLVIDKGSVIVVDVSEGYDDTSFALKIQKPIGLYVSEGHGEVIVNPSWLLAKKVKFSDTDKSNNDNTVEKYNYKNDTNKWLTSERESTVNAAKLLSKVFVFINDKDNDVTNKKSQWGQIRSRCRQSKNSLELYKSLFVGDKAFLRHGRALSKWDNSLIVKLDEIAKYKELNDGIKSVDEDYKQFMTLLSIYAPKEDDKRPDNNQGGI